MSEEEAEDLEEKSKEEGFEAFDRPDVSPENKIDVKDEGQEEKGTDDSILVVTGTQLAYSGDFPVANDEMGSRYLVESGFYITSFAATIFITALVTVGVLLITLLIAVTVMLQSCQSKSAGFIQLQRSSNDFDYCKIVALHAELNSLEADEFPTICKTHAIWYIKEGKYLSDLNYTIWLVESYFSTVTPQDDGLDVVLMDVDDMFSSNPHYSNLLQSRFDQYGGDDWIKEAKHMSHMLIMKLYKKLRDGGWSFIFITRKPEKQRNATIERLVSAGYGGWSSLVMRLDNETQIENQEYFSRRRAELQNQGFRITSVISSQMDALTGPCLGKRIFKLANPIYYKLELHIESMGLLQ
ncbi:hypothetical protein HHK36_016258 [Tetracentron sinense]|uniref:Acid phosphatase n=1 Tax=Tetracentron sinense TaxID=13715 RepID=A0A834Z0F5_TETSI|nr:hypothetical protein HHK36_016258 [Tetracentron sinense]